MPGFERAMDDGMKYVATLNNDAVADKDWLKHLAAALDKNPKAGIVTCQDPHCRRQANSTAPAII